MKKKIWLSGILLVFYGCNPAAKNQRDTFNYFDLKGYFEKEAARLTKNNPAITKTVTVNDAAESKETRIADWTKELAIFSDADLNRNAWKGLFKAVNAGNQEIYTSDQEKIPVKEVRIIKRNGEVYQIRILVKNTNILYSSADTLSYYPDSLYQVKKKQHIKLLAEKRYTITGKFK
jgi:hypothetical protein